MAVLEIRKIITNLDDHVCSLATSELYHPFYTDYKEKIMSLSSTNDKEYAQGILDTLKYTIPRILKFKYGSCFFQKGLIFLYDKETP